MLKHLCGVAVLVAAAACGGNGSGTDSPTAPTPQPQPQANRSPAINSILVTPTFGIADLQVFSFSATASDPDGDAVTYAWTIAGSNFPGSNGQLLFPSPGGFGRATLTVLDGRGGTTSASANFIIGSMSGDWRVVDGPLTDTTFQLNQNPAGIVTGTFTLPGFGSGTTDPAEPGRITAAGDLTMRVKLAPYTDFTLTGTMDTTGQLITGNIRGSGFTGQPFVMVK